MKTTWLLLALAAGTINVPLLASDDLSQGDIRALVNQGKILSLETILTRYPEKIYGKLLDLEAEREHGSVIYELEFLQADGRVFKLEVDAVDGRLIKQEIED
jgi:uncharacterized membrane protein YkoI